MSEGETEQYKSLEDEVFKSLDNQKRRDILRYIGEKRGVTFTDILNAVKMPDSPTLSYHLRALSAFTKQVDGKYSLTPIGRDAYGLLLKTGSYDVLALSRRRKYEVTLGNGILWLAAIAATLYLGADFMLFGVIMPILAAVSMSMTYALFE